MFYTESRFYYDGPQEPKQPMCTCKGACGIRGGKVNPAAYKCYSCVKFDTFGKGWFCGPCFEKLHPWYREKHKYVSIDQDDDVEYDLQVANYQAELDRTVRGFEKLLKGVRGAQETCEKMDADTRPNDMLKANAHQMDKASKRVWELKHYVRSQLLASKDGENAVRDLEYNDEHMRLKEKVPYRTVTGLTPYALRLHGDSAKVKRQVHQYRDHKPDLSPDAAAIIMQCAARRNIARNEMLALVSMNYQRHWSWRYNRYYYTDLRERALAAARPPPIGGDAPKHKTRWRRPPAVRNGMEAVVLTPRSFRTVHGKSDCADIEFLLVNLEINKPPQPKKTDEGPMEVDEEGNPIFDPNYFKRHPVEDVELEKKQTKTKEEEEEMKKKKKNKKGNEQPIAAVGAATTTSIIIPASEDDAAAGQQPSLSLVPVAAASAITLSRIKKKQIDDLAARMRERVLVLNKRANELMVAREKAHGKGPVSREIACKRLQGACRIWLSRKELAARAEYIFYLVQPELPKQKKKAGKKPRAYYFNILTRKSYWNKPKCFGSKNAKEVSVEEAVKRTGRLEARLRKKIFNVDLTYPLTNQAKRVTAIVYIQCIVREFLARVSIRAKTRERWVERIDVETALPYYHNLVTGADVWDRPWSPSNVLEKKGRLVRLWEG